MMEFFNFPISFQFQFLPFLKNGSHSRESGRNVRKSRKCGVGNKSETDRGQVKHLCSFVRKVQVAGCWSGIMFKLGLVRTFAWGGPRN